MTRIICCLLGLLLAACGGRKAEPVEAVRASDPQLTCAHIAAERRVNQSRVADLAGESQFRTQNNVGMLLASPLFLDLSDSVQVEIRAIDERNVQLDKLSAAKGCAPA